MKISPVEQKPGHLSSSWLLLKLAEVPYLFQSKPEKSPHGKGLDSGENPAQTPCWETRRRRHGSEGAAGPASGTFVARSSGICSSADLPGLCGSVPHIENVTSFSFPDIIVF